MNPPSYGGKVLQVTGHRSLEVCGYLLDFSEEQLADRDLWSDARGFGRAQQERWWREQEATAFQVRRRGSLLSTERSSKGWIFGKKQTVEGAGRSR